MFPGRWRTGGWVLAYDSGPGSSVEDPKFSGNDGGNLNLQRLAMTGGCGSAAYRVVHIAFKPWGKQFVYYIMFLRICCQSWSPWVLNGTALLVRSGRQLVFHPIQQVVDAIASWIQMWSVPRGRGGFRAPGFQVSRASTSVFLRDIKRPHGHDGGETRHNGEKALPWKITAEQTHPHAQHSFVFVLPDDRRPCEFRSQALN